MVLDATEFPDAGGVGRALKMYIYVCIKPANCARRVSESTSFRIPQLRGQLWQRAATKTASVGMRSSARPQALN
jgi:hypothetical protein